MNYQRQKHKRNLNLRGSVLEFQRGWIINNNGIKLKVTVGKESQFGEMTYFFDGEILVLKFGQGNQIRWNGFNGMFHKFDEMTASQWPLHGTSMKYLHQAVSPYPALVRSPSTLITLNLRLC